MSARSSPVSGRDDDAVGCRTTLHRLVRLLLDDRHHQNFQPATASVNEIAATPQCLLRKVNASATSTEAEKAHGARPAEPQGGQKDRSSEARI
jgi:hypothetical protein